MPVASAIVNNSILSHTASHMHNLIYWAKKKDTTENVGQ